MVNSNSNNGYVFITQFCIRSELTALGRAVNFEASCRWALVSVQITGLVTLPYYYIYCTKVHLSSCQ